MRKPGHGSSVLLLRQTARQRAARLVLVLGVLSSVLSTGCRGPGGPPGPDTHDEGEMGGGSAPLVVGTAQFPAGGLGVLSGIEVASPQSIEYIDFSAGEAGGPTQVQFRWRPHMGPVHGQWGDQVANGAVWEMDMRMVYVSGVRRHIWRCCQVDVVRNDQQDVLAECVLDRRCEGLVLIEVPDEVEETPK